MGLLGILLGLGCDVIEVARVRGVVERQGERFLARVFTDEERAVVERYLLGAMDAIRRIL